MNDLFSARLAELLAEGITLQACDYWLSQPLPYRVWIGKVSDPIPVGQSGYARGASPWEALQAAEKSYREGVRAYIPPEIPPEIPPAPTKKSLRVLSEQELEDLFSDLGKPTR